MSSYRQGMSKKGCPLDELTVENSGSLMLRVSEAQRSVAILPSLWSSPLMLNTLCYQYLPHELMNWLDEMVKFIFIVRFFC